MSKNNGIWNPLNVITWNWDRMLKWFFYHCNTNALPTKIVLSSKHINFFQFKYLFKINWSRSLFSCTARIDCLLLQNLLLYIIVIWIGLFWFCHTSNLRNESLIFLYLPSLITLIWSAFVQISDWSYFDQ